MPIRRGVSSRLTSKDLADCSTARTKCSDCAKSALPILRRLDMYT